MQNSAENGTGGIWWLQPELAEHHLSVDGTTRTGNLNYHEEKDETRSVLWLCPKRAVYSVGRNQGSFCFPTDRTVSRVHAKFIWKASELTWSLVDQGSKYGTVVNEQSIDAHQPRLLKAGDRIQFGNYSSRFKIYFNPVVLCGSGLSAAQQAELQTHSASCGFQWSTKWTQHVTHLVMTNLVATEKAIRSLQSAQWIVRPSFVEVFSSHALIPEEQTIEEELQSFLVPDPRTFLPDVDLSCQVGPEISWFPNTKRGSLFQDIAFLLLDVIQENRVGPIIEGSNGRVVSTTSLAPPQVAGGRSIVLLEPPSHMSLFDQLCHRYAVVSERQLGLAIIHASIDDWILSKVTEAELEDSVMSSPEVLGLSVPATIPTRPVQQLYADDTDDDLMGQTSVTDVGRNREPPIKRLRPASWATSDAMVVEMTEEENSDGEEVFVPSTPPRKPLKPVLDLSHRAQSKSVDVAPSASSSPAIKPSSTPPSTSVQKVKRRPKSRTSAMSTQVVLEKEQKNPALSEKDQSQQSILKQLLDPTRQFIRVEYVDMAVSRPPLETRAGSSIENRQPSFNSKKFVKQWHPKRDIQGILPVIGIEDMDVTRPTMGTKDEPWLESIPVPKQSQGQKKSTKKVLFDGDF